MLLDDLLHLESVRCQVEAAETALPRPDSLFRQVLASAHIRRAQRTLWYQFNPFISHYP